MITRQIRQQIADNIFQRKAIVLMGARQVGKTTLIREIINKTNKTTLFLDGDDPTVRQLLDNPSTEHLRLILGTNKIVFIDEAQRIPNIGLTSKIIIDQFKEKQLILSGSSSFELGNHLQEPLTGRKWTYELLPISWPEWQNHVGYLKAEQDLENRLVYGLYPEVLNNRESARNVLLELVNSYLYKDLLAFGGIRKPEIIQKLVQALAYQVGQEVVYKEIGDLIKLDPKTISGYIDILEKAYVVFRLPAFSRNLRNEIKNNRKVYFYDNGVRNSVIGKLEPLPGRQDIGALWENFLISERIKQLKYSQSHATFYFWRTKQQQEIDYLEEDDGKISGFEFKWKSKSNIRFPKTFTNQYNAEVNAITRSNFREFVILPD